MLESERKLNELDGDEEKLKASLEKIKRDRARLLDEVVGEKLVIAAATSNTLFENIFAGTVSKLFGQLSELVIELYKLDPKFATRLSADRYGLAETDALKFFTQFVATALYNNRGLSDIIASSRKHADNPYLARDE